MDGEKKGNPVAAEVLGISEMQLNNLWEEQI